MAGKRGKGLSFGEGEDPVCMAGSCGVFFPVEPVP